MVILGAVYGLGFATLVPTCARKEAQIPAEEITIRFIYIYIRTYWWMHKYIWMCIITVYILNNHSLCSNYLAMGSHGFFNSEDRGAKISPSTSSSLVNWWIFCNSCSRTSRLKSVLWMGLKKNWGDPLGNGFWDALFTIYDIPGLSCALFFWALPHYSPDMWKTFCPTSQDR